MSTFNEIGSGGVLTAGCVLVTFLDKLHTIYAKGDFAYNVNKARVGVLERVVIKRQRVIQNIKTHGLLTVLYVDTLNALWSDSDLVPFSEAQSLATIYLDGLLDELDKIDLSD